MLLNNIHNGQAAHHNLSLSGPYAIETDLQALDGAEAAHARVGLPPGARGNRVQCKVGQVEGGVPSARLRRVCKVVLQAQQRLLPSQLSPEACTQQKARSAKGAAYKL